MNYNWSKEHVGGKACLLAGVWEVSGIRLMAKERCRLPSGEEDIKRVLRVV
jgi:hypothetical protein